MLNFLPEQLRKSVKREYLLRVLSIFLGFLFFAGIILIALFVPSQALYLYKDAVVSNELSMMKSVEAISKDDPVRAIRSANDIIKSTDLNIQTVRISDLVLSALKIKGSGVSVTDISVSTNDPLSKFVISVGGISKSRDGLISFVKDLKDGGMFSSVDLPVSDLVKSTDVDFSLKLYVKK
jgi:hypothetical protein